MTCRNLSAVHHVQGTAAVLLYALHEVTAVLAAAHVHIFNNLVIMTFFLNQLCYLMPQLLVSKASRCSTGHSDFYLNVIHSGAGIKNAFSLGNHVFINFGSSTACFQLNSSDIRHNIASCASVEYAYVDTAGALAVTGNGIQGNCSLCRCQQSILSLLRSSACVCRYTGKFRIQLRSCQKTISHRY